MSEAVHKALEEIRRFNPTHHLVNRTCDDLALELGKRKPLGPLSGTFISVKDNICVKGVETTAGSAILQGYRPPMHATAVQRAIDAGAIPIAMTAMDEFGFGGFGVNVGNNFSIAKNPLDLERSCGGSSSGAGGLTKKALFPHIALAESTGGSIVNPASFCGVVGLCPTYGRVSRYGLIDYANSLDKIGVMARTVQEAALLLSVISGNDPKDSTSATHLREDFTAQKPVKGMTLGVVKEAWEGVDEKIVQQCWRSIKQYEQQGVKIEEISLPLTMQYGIPAYYVLAMSEASTNLAKYCGIRYGQQGQLPAGFNEYFTSVRSKYFGQEAKRRIILGTFARMSGHRNQFYLQAAKVRTMIIDEYLRQFRKVDAIVTPTMPFVAPRFREIEQLTPLQHYAADRLTVGPNLAGLPHISIPAGDAHGMPVGLMLTGAHFDESTIISLAGKHG